MNNTDQKKLFWVVFCLAYAVFMFTPYSQDLRTIARAVPEILVRLLRPTKAHAAPVTSYTPPIEYYTAHASEHTRVGDELTATLELPCTSTKESLVDATAYAAENIRRNAAPVIATQSPLLKIGDKFTVLELELNRAKIRIRGVKDCWVPSLVIR